MKSSLHAFDNGLGKLISTLPKWIHGPMLFMTFLGQPIITGGLGALIIGLGIGSGSHTLKMAGLVAVGTIIVGSLLKLILRRDRPITEYVEHMYLDTFSFPSGHAAGTVPVFGLLAYLVALSYQPWGVAVAAVIAIITFLIGVSRVYLGAHYASDVIGGWIVGLSGLAVIIFIVQPTL